jgi:hypothetical protein
MSSNVAGLLPVAVTALAAGAGGAVIGAVITTYGGKARERRQARSGVIACLSAIEIKRRRKTPGGDGIPYTADDFPELEVKCMIAGVPRDLLRLYQEATERFQGLTSPPDMKNLAEQAPQLGVYLAASSFIGRAAEMLTEAAWHPLLSRPLRRRRARKLIKMIDDISHASGRTAYMFSHKDYYRLWRYAALKTTRRDRTAKRIRDWLGRPDPLMARSPNRAVTPSGLGSETPREPGSIVIALVSDDSCVARPVNGS